MIQQKILGVVQFDVLVWFFFWVMYFILFYEHFVDDERYKKISKNAPKVFYFGVFVAILIIIIYFLKQDLLRSNYTYFRLCLGVLAIFILISLKKQKLVKKILPISGFFFFVYLSHEIVSLTLNQWSFPGQYLGMVPFWGVSFPIEELIFWICFSSTIGATYYEVSFDDGK